MNNYVFNNSGNPLFVVDPDSIQVLSAKGNVFGAVKTDFLLDVLYETNSIRIYNKSTSTKTVFISQLSVSLNPVIASIGVLISLIRNGTHSSSGTLDNINYNFGSSNVSGATVTYSTTAGVGSEVIFSSLQTVSVYNEIFNNSIAIPPDKSLVIDIRSLIAGGQNVTVNIVWCEI